MIRTNLLLLAVGVLLASPSRADEAFPLDAGHIEIRDPFVLADPATKTYYLYAADGPHHIVEAYESSDLKKWTVPKVVFTKPADFWGGDQIWAPEVHLFGGKYYMFVTFDGRGGRGTEILRADQPGGPFLVFSPNANTPPEQQCLDGTPWVDAAGRNWLVYCEEWTRVKDGAMRAVEMSPDWSSRVGESHVLFHASQAPWAAPIGPGCYVTDGPYLRAGKDGKLRMIWSSFLLGGSYAVGVAESGSGAVEGPWVQLPEPLFRQNGGHGMIFEDFGGRTLLLIHVPNSGAAPHPVFFELEGGDALRIKGPLNL